MSSLLEQPLPPPIGHFCRCLVTLIFVIQKFRDNTFLEEDKTIILPPSKQKSDHYSLRNRENEKHIFAGGPVREGGNASLVGPILILFVSLDSYCPQLSKSVFEIFVSQKLTKLQGSIPHRFTEKLW